MLTQIKITPKDVSKIKEIDSVLEATWPDGPNCSDLLRCEKYCCSDFFAFYEKNKLIGFINIIHERDFNFAGFFIVKEIYRNKGYGTKILNIIKEQYSVKPLIAETNPVLLNNAKKEINTRKNNFYIRNGFKITSHLIKPLYPLTKNGQNIMTTDLNVDYKDIESTFFKYWYLWYRIKKEG